MASERTITDEHGNTIGRIGDLGEGWGPQGEGWWWQRASDGLNSGASLTSEEEAEEGLREAAAAG